MDKQYLDAQYFRQIEEGNVTVEGRSSNAVILDNTGNTFIVSGMNENEITALQNQNYQGNISVNGNNSSYIAVKTKNEVSTQEPIVLGNNNYGTFNETLNQNSNPDNIITPQSAQAIEASPTPLPAKEKPIPTPTPTPIPSLEEGETVSDFLPEREDQEFFQVFDVLVQNPNDVLQNPPAVFSLSVINTTKAVTENRKIKSNSGGKIPKDGSEFKKYGSLFKIIQTGDVKDNLGNQIYYPTALFNQGDPLWGSTSDGSYTLRAAGCAYVSFCMLVTHHKNDPGYTPEWMWDNASKSVVTYWNALAKAAGLTAVRESGTMSRIDELLKTRPVEFEWVKATARKNGYKGESYASVRQHWMVIVGKNTDGTYTIFDPNGGKIRTNVSAFSIESGLNNIVYIK